MAQIFGFRFVIVLEFKLSIIVESLCSKVFFYTKDSCQNLNNLDNKWTYLQQQVCNAMQVWFYIINHFADQGKRKIEISGLQLRGNLDVTVNLEFTLKSPMTKFRIF